VESLLREGRFEEASALLSPLLAAAPNDPSLLALKARVLYGEQRFEESLPAFREALALREDPELRREMERARLSVVLSKADRLAAEGKDDEAEALLRAEYDGGSERYETGIRLGRVYLRRREFTRAADHYLDMSGRFPGELDFRASRIEALLLSGDVEGGRREIAALPPGDREALRVAREDLFYRIAGNSLRISGELAEVDRGRPDENRLSVEGVFRPMGATVTAGAETLSRYDDREGRLYADLRTPVGEEGNGAFGALHADLAPSADFLPRWSLGAEGGVSIRRHDLSAGYLHRHFPSSDAGIAHGSFTAWLPLDVALSERFSVALSTRAWSSLTTFRYEPDHTLRIHASISFGTLAERTESAADLERHFGYSDRAGVEIRPTVSYSYGGELFHEHRDGEGDRYGLSLLARYWW
jgi:YaiO family outer membrane protein